ncbi:MAG: CopD family protein [Deltaproteobacteria bacterium]|nr:CopD family protein [Deltaproteobacteria bacterium]
MVWIGGMLFLVLVVVPWLRGGGQIEAGVFLRETGVRFRNVGWSCFLLLLITGTFNLWVRGVRLSDFGRAEWLASPLGETVVLKLGVFLLVLVVSAVHDFVVGPRATRAIAADPRSPGAQRLRRRTSVLGRVNVVLALILVAAGVMLVRGVPW